MPGQPELHETISTKHNNKLGRTTSLPSGVRQPWETAPLTHVLFCSSMSTPPPILHSTKGSLGFCSYSFPLSAWSPPTHTRSS